jgi:hypothetical protein
MVAGDIVINPDGRPNLITGQQKLSQDVVEILLVGRTDEGYGAGLGDMIGTIQGFVPASLGLRILTALEYYQGLQSTQPNVSPSEQLRRVVNVTSNRVYTGNKTDYAFSVYIQNGQDQKPLQICMLKRPPLGA